MAAIFLGLNLFMNSTYTHKRIMILLLKNEIRSQKWYTGTTTIYHNLNKYQCLVIQTNHDHRLLKINMASGLEWGLPKLHCLTSRVVNFRSSKITVRCFSYRNYTGGPLHHVLSVAECCLLSSCCRFCYPKTISDTTKIKRNPDLTL